MPEKKKFSLNEKRFFTNFLNQENSKFIGSTPAADRDID